MSGPHVKPNIMSYIQILDEQSTIRKFCMVMAAKLTPSEAFRYGRILILLVK